MRKLSIFLLVSTGRDNLRIITTFAIMCMLFFAIVSCENSDDPLPSDDPFAIFGTTDGAGRLNAKFYVFAFDDSDCDYLLFHDRGSIGHFHNSFFAPINLPEEFQRNGLHVAVTFRRTTQEKCHRPVIEIIGVEEVRFSSRFYVRNCDDYGYLLFEDLEDPERALIVSPINLK